MNLKKPNFLFYKFSSFHHEQRIINKFSYFVMIFQKNKILVKKSKNWILYLYVLFKDGGTSLRRKEEKLLEQFTEAQELKTSVYKRVSTVSAFIQELLGDQEQSLHTLYTRVRVQLLVQQRLLADKIEITEQKIAALRTL